MASFLLSMAQADGNTTPKPVASINSSTVVTDETVSSTTPVSTTTTTGPTSSHQTISPSICTPAVVSSLALSQANSVSLDDMEKEEYNILNRTIGKLAFVEQQAAMQKIKQDATSILPLDFFSKTSDEKRTFIENMSSEKQRVVLRFSALNKVINEFQQTQSEMQHLAQKFSQIIPSMPQEMITANELKLREHAMKVLPFNFSNLTPSEQNEAISNVSFENRNAVLMWNCFLNVMNILENNKDQPAKDDCCLPTGG